MVHAVLPYVSQRARLLPALALFIFASPGIFFCPPPRPPGQLRWPPSPFLAVPAQGGSAGSRCPSGRARARLSGGCGAPAAIAAPASPCGNGERKSRPRVQPDPGAPSVTGASRRAARGGPVAASSRTALRSGGAWGSFEWRWRAIALATAGCASPAPACRAEGSPPPLPYRSPAPRRSSGRSPSRAAPAPFAPRSPPCRGRRGRTASRTGVMPHVAESIPSTRCSAFPRAPGHAPFRPVARAGGAALAAPPRSPPLVFIPPRAAVRPVRPRVVLNANLTSRGGRRRTTYAQQTGRLSY